MAILLLFNSSDILTFHDIRENTNLPEKELLKQLQTLIDTKIVSRGKSSKREIVMLYIHVKKIVYLLHAS